MLLGAQPAPAAFEPAIGAVLLALESAGVQIDDAVRANLRASAPVGEFFDT